MIQTSLPVPSINFFSVNEVMISLDTLHVLYHIKYQDINIEISYSILKLTVCRL